jgi:hypothetical protein
MLTFIFHNFRLMHVPDWGVGVYSTVLPVIPIIPSPIDATVELSHAPLTGQTGVATIRFVTFSNLPRDTRINVALPDFELPGITLGSISGIADGVSIIGGISGLTVNRPHGLECTSDPAWSSGLPCSFL